MLIVYKLAKSEFSRDDSDDERHKLTSVKQLEEWAYPLAGKPEAEKTEEEKVQDKVLRHERRLKVGMIKACAAMIKGDFLRSTIVENLMLKRELNRYDYCPKSSKPFIDWI